MKELFRLLVLLPLLPGFLYAQVGQEAGIGLYGGTAFLSHVRRSDDYKGRYTPNESRSYSGGIGIYHPLTNALGFGLETGFEQHKLAYAYSTDRIGTQVVSDVNYYNVVVAPAITLNPPVAKGFYARLALPIAIKLGNRGTYRLRYPQNNWLSVDYSDQIADYRATLCVGPEISLGYLYTWKNGNGIWVRGSTWRASTEFWKPSFTETPELPKLKRLSIELGFRIGTPRLRLFGRNNLNQAQPLTE